MNDIVIDANVMAMLGSNGGGDYRNLFDWLRSKGVISLSRKMVVEYGGGRNRFVASLLSDMVTSGRYNDINQKIVNGFVKSSNFNFSSNFEDRYVVGVTVLVVEKF